MNVLLVKLTSMGDLIHALPALTDAKRHHPDIRFDWVIEKSFSEIARWHPAVNTIITTSHRQWRQHPWQSYANGEIQRFLAAIRKAHYDLIIDGQTSIKSAATTLLARGQRHGLSRKAAREWIAPLAYQKSYFIDKNMHAIERLRLLFAQALNYPYSKNPPDYGIENYPFPKLPFNLPEHYLVFIHNASWQSKLLPEHRCRELIALATQEGLHVLLPWGNTIEKQRAQRLAAQHPDTVHVLPFCTLSEHARILKGAVGAICCDTGLSHLSAALNVPAVTLYGPTSAKLIGTTGLNQRHITSSFSCMQCYKHQCHFQKQAHPEALCLTDIQPEAVWQQFKQVCLR